jgi:hypothetical protein
MLTKLPTSPNIAVCIIAYNRPEYFFRTLTALRANAILKDLPVHIILDGGVGASVSENQAVITSVGIKPHEVVVRPQNYGCGWNLIDVRRRIFDHCQYDAAFIFEDDFLPQVTYLQEMINLLSWTQEHFDNVGVVQGWSDCWLSPTMRQKASSFVHTPHLYTNLWGYLMTRPCWDAIRDRMYDLENRFFVTVPYAERDTKGITQALRDFPEQPLVREGRLWNSPRYLAQRHKNVLNRWIPAGQDGATDTLMHLAGIERVATVVNRGRYIGKKGIHMTPEHWGRLGLDLMVDDAIPIRTKFWRCRFNNYAVGRFLNHIQMRRKYRLMSEIESDTERKIATQQSYWYSREGLDSRRINFCDDNTISAGSTDMEKRWCVVKKEGSPRLIILGDEPENLTLGATIKGNNFYGNRYQQEKCSVVIRPTKAVSRLATSVQNPGATVCILNWKRPENVQDLCHHYLAFDNIHDVLVWNNNKDVTFSREDAGIVNSNDDFGLYTRFMLSLLATTQCILLHDDDIILSEGGFNYLFEAWSANSSVLHGVQGCDPTPDNKYKEEIWNGPADMVLTRICMTHRDYCMRYFAYASKFNVVQKDNVGNGEDIIFSYMVKHLSGCKNQIHDAERNELTAEHSIHHRTGHWQHRTDIMRMAQETTPK